MSNKTTQMLIGKQILLGFIYNKQIFYNLLICFSQKGCLKPLKLWLLSHYSNHSVNVKCLYRIVRATQKFLLGFSTFFNCCFGEICNVWSESLSLMLLDVCCYTWRRLLEILGQKLTNAMHSAVFVWHFFINHCKNNWLFLIISKEKNICNISNDSLHTVWTTLQYVEKNTHIKLIRHGRVVDNSMIPYLEVVLNELWLQWTNKLTCISLITLPFPSPSLVVKFILQRCLTWGCLKKPGCSLRLKLKYSPNVADRMKAKHLWL